MADHMPDGTEGPRGGMWGYDVCVSHTPLAAIMRAVSFRDKSATDEAAADRECIKDIRRILNQVHAEAMRLAIKFDPEFATLATAHLGAAKRVTA
jgi:hypothetical protein